jgi:hypothetical protein
VSLISKEEGAHQWMGGSNDKRKEVIGWRKGVIERWEGAGN